MAVGRISGPLLKANLIRNGIDLAFETDLLYLDVNNNRVGIKNSSPQYELDVTGTTRTTDLTVTNRADIGNVNIVGNTISSDESFLNLGTLDNVVYQNRLRVDSIDLEGNRISTNESNANLEIEANGTGTVEVLSDMNVTGNIHATGNITADGDITLGDQNTDNIVFNADVASDIIPDLDDTYTLGSDPVTGGKQWNDIYVTNFVAGAVSTDSLTVDNINLVLRQGNIIYVAENGDDTHTGTHPADPVASIKHALTLATAGDVVHVYAGSYTEEFPLTVPVGVTVKGQSIRSVSISPTVATQNNDAFLLNGESTIEDLTVKDFFTGYAFKFAPGFTVTTRSPYIRNVSVITAGSVTTAEDPRGFNQGDAGKGALVDGSIATASSKEAAMLFHSVTFITPGVDGLEATNGARIEWLNSFTYFANRGLYAYDSSAGLKGDGKTRIRLSGISGTFLAGDTVTFTSTDSSTVINVSVESVENNETLVIDGKNTDLLGFDTTPQSISNGTATATTIENIDVRDFGAEVRMIGSANVYGNFGLYGDGEGVIVYAIGQNLAYIGNGKEVTNDPGTVIQENEVVELNDAKIRYNSVDHKGDFRVGDLFYVDQDSGSVNFVASALNIDLTSGITFTTGGDTTFISGERIDTGNLRISGNTIESLAGDLNFDSFSDIINLNNDVNITGDLDVTGNVTIGGNITIGDDASDTINIVAGIDSDIIPSITSTYSLGTNSKQWSNLFVNKANIDGIQITQNYITTTESNADLDLRANGTGDVVVPSNDVQIDNNITVDGTATLANTNITGTVTLVGDFNQTGDTDISGDVEVTQDLSVGASAQFEEILIDDNFVTTTSSNTDLELRANGTGEILVPNNDVHITNDLTVDGTITVGDINSAGTITANRFSTGDILIDDNFITTTLSNSDLELRANGTGIISIPSNDVVMSNDLTVGGDITVTNSVTISDTLTVQNINSSGSIQANNFTTGDILIDDNFITTTTSNSNLELRANGTGSIVLDTFSINNFTISTTGDMDLTPGSGNIIVNGTGSLKLPSGDTGQRPTAEAGQIRFNSELARFEGYDGTNWIKLNGVQDIDGNTKITAELVPGANDNTIRFYINGNIVAEIDADKLTTDKIIVDDIQVDGNVISTITPDTDLQLSAQGTGEVVLENFSIKDNDITNTVAGAVTTISTTGTGYVNISGTSGIVLPVGGNVTRPTGVAGMIRFNTDDARVELYDGTTWVSVAGASGGISFNDAENIAIEKVLIFG